MNKNRNEPKQPRTGVGGIGQDAAVLSCGDLGRHPARDRDVGKLTRRVYRLPALPRMIQRRFLQTFASDCHCPGKSWITKLHDCPQRGRQRLFMKGIVARFRPWFGAGRTGRTQGERIASVGTAVLPGTFETDAGSLAVKGEQSTFQRGQLRRAVLRVRKRPRVLHFLIISRSDIVVLYYYCVYKMILLSLLAVAADDHRIIKMTKRCRYVITIRSCVYFQHSLFRYNSK